MNSNHVSVDLGAAIECFDTFRALVFKRSLVSIPVQFESSGILKGLVARMTSECVQIEE